MQSLDFLTLHYSLVLNTTTLSIIWLGIAVTYRDFIAARYWMSGSFMTAIGAILLSFSLFENLYLIIVLGNFLIISGFGCFYLGLQAFYQRPVRTILLQLAIITGAGLAATLVQYDNWLWRSAIYNLTYLLVLLSMLVFMILREDKAPGIYVSVAALFIGMLCQLTTLAMIYGAAHQIITLPEFLAFYSYNFLIMQFSGGTLTFGFFILTIDALRKEMAQIANRDYVTGLPNRSQFAASIEQAERDYQNSKICYAVMMIDIDDFKGFNDQYGHRLGDEILRHFTATVSALITPLQLLSRHGGDEFCILMRHSSHHDALALAKAIKERLETAVLMLHGVSHHITLSTGMAVRSDMLEDGINAILNEADKALYRVKRAGRNGYEIYRPCVSIH